jgi:hypothetical protein
MSRAGEVWDNSAMESFFSSLEAERTARKVFRTREQVRAEVFDCIERFHNPTRRHSTLGYVRPIAFEKAREAQVGVHQTGSSPVACRRASNRLPNVSTSNRIACDFSACRRAVPSAPSRPSRRAFTSAASKGLASRPQPQLQDFPKNAPKIGICR